MRRGATLSSELASASAGGRVAANGLADDLEPLLRLGEVVWLLAGVQEQSPAERTAATCAMNRRRVARSTGGGFLRRRVAQYSASAGSSRDAVALTRVCRTIFV